MRGHIGILRVVFFFYFRFNQDYSLSLILRKCFEYLNITIKNLYYDVVAISECFIENK